MGGWMGRGWATEKPQRVKKQEVLGLEGGGLERGGNRAGDTHTLIPTPRPESPACTRPDLQASLPLYSSTSARFPSSALPFNRMSLSSGDMK